MKNIYLTIIVVFLSSAKSQAEEIKTEEIKTEEIKYLPCTSMWITNMSDLQMSFCATYEEALVIADREFEKCLEETYGN